MGCQARAIHARAFLSLDDRRGACAGGRDDGLARSVVRVLAGSLFPGIGVALARGGFLIFLCRAGVFPVLSCKRGMFVSRPFRWRGGRFFLWGVVRGDS